MLHKAVLSSPDANAGTLYIYRLTTHIHPLRSYAILAQVYLGQIGVYVKLIFSPPARTFPKTS